MVPGKLNLKFTQGDDYSRRLTFLADAADPDSFYNYSDMTFEAQVRPTSGSATSWAFTVDDTDANIGEVVITLSDAQTVDMPVAAVWDMQMTTSGGETTTILAGSVTVRREVTR